MTALHFAGGALVLLLILFVGYWSGRKVQSADDFAGKSRKAGTGVVAGAIIGTLVGGSSTIGTAQLAFNYGFSAWWFTLGGGIGLLIMGLIYVKPLYKGDALTLPSILSENYGAQSAMAATFLTSIGSFLSIVAQLLSSVGLITAVSAISPFYAALLTAALMMVYVIFGGVMGAGKVGMVKTILMYVGIGLCRVQASPWRSAVFGEKRDPQPLRNRRNRESAAALA
jgi:SSS family solute:Na+ symporter